MKQYKAITVQGPRGGYWMIPEPALEDWNSWIELAGDRWTPPLYAKLEDGITPELPYGDDNERIDCV